MNGWWNVPVLQRIYRLPISTSRTTSRTTQSAVTRLLLCHQAYQPYLTLQKSENNIISIMIVADKPAWKYAERIRRVQAPSCLLFASL